MSARAFSTARCGVALAVLFAGCAGAAPVEPQQPACSTSRGDLECLVLSARGRPFFSYRDKGAPFKPYIRELCTPSGVQVLRDSPADHVHHRGVMFALEANKADFWAETGASGKQIPRGDARTSDGIARGDIPCVRIAQTLDWCPAGAEKPTLTEDRILEVYVGVPGATLLTWRSRLRPAEGLKATISGSHYQGLGMRFVTSMDGAETFLHAAGAVGPVVRGTEHVTPSSWSAYTASAEGKPVTAALFDHPKNVRGPAGMFTMFKPFSYLSATPNVWKQPLELKAGETLDLRYGVAVMDGAAGREVLEALHKTWLGLAGE